MKDLIDKIQKARFIWVCGNGGSASTAEHLTNDMYSKNYPAICLNSNVSIITKTANDSGYKYIFCDQLSVYANKEDLLITISCSGKSPNIVKALEFAEIEGLMTYSFNTFVDGDENYEMLENEHLRLVHRIKRKL